MRTAFVTAPSVKAAEVAVRRSFGLPLTPVVVNDGCGDGNYRITYPSGDVAEVLVILHKPTQIEQVTT